MPQKDPPQDAGGAAPKQGSAPRPQLTVTRSDTRVRADLVTPRQQGRSADSSVLWALFAPDGLEPWELALVGSLTGDQGLSCVQEAVTALFEGGDGRTVRFLDLRELRLIDNPCRDTLCQAVTAWIARGHHAAVILPSDDLADLIVNSLKARREVNVFFSRTFRAKIVAFPKDADSPTSRRPRTISSPDEPQ